MIAPPAALPEIAGRVGRALAVLLDRRATQLAALVFGLLLVYISVFPLVSPYSGYDVDFTQSRQGPSLDHPLGTDQFGRDLLTRLAIGGQTTLLIAGGALGVILAIGFVWGTIAALAGGKTDAVMMRIVDGLLAIPRLPIAIVILVAFRLASASIWAIVLALSIAGWMLTARLVRGHVLSLKAREYVRAARAIGSTWPQVARRHILPNSGGILVIAVLLELPTVVVGEAFLSVLGLGPPAPRPTWGNIAQEGWHFFRIWEMLWATIAIALFALSANVLADGLHDALDPRRRSQRTPRPAKQRPRWRLALAPRRG